MIATEGRQWVRATIVHASPCLVEGTVLPLILFTVVVHTLGVTPALWVTLLWAGLALGRRAVRGRRLSGVLILGAMGAGLRLATLVANLGPSVFFLQPVLGTVGCALAFGLSVPLGRPLAARLGADLVPLDEDDWDRPDVRRVCARISLVWMIGLLVNAGLTMWLLWSLPVATFVLVKPLVGVVSTLPTIVVSFVLGLRVVRRAGYRLVTPSAPVQAPTAELAAAA